MKCGSGVEAQLGLARLAPGSGSGGSQAALLAPIIFSPQKETAVFSSKDEGQPSSLTSPARVLAASPSWLGAQPSSHEWDKRFPSKAKRKGASQHQRVPPSPFLWLVVYPAPACSQISP